MPVPRPRLSLPGVLALLLALCPVGLADGRPALALTTPTSTVSGVTVRHVLDTGASPASVRLARDPRDNTLYYLKQDGSVYRVDLAAATSALAYGPSATGVSNAQGLAIGPTGAMYVVGNEDRPNTETRATIMKGVLGSGGQRTWSILARTADYPKSATAFDHRFSGIAVGLDGASVFVNSGSRTDHGEVQSAGGLYPDTREVGLTALILRLPADGAGIALPDDRAALKSAGYVYAEGTRNSFDFAYAPNGDLLATDNGPDRDMSDELNWLRPGLHYGFPWRIGGADNPQQYPGYDPSKDLLLDPRFTAVKNGYYHDDPAFPPRPSGVTLQEPIANSGPDADSYRDPADGVVKDASSHGRSISSFTAHRSPLGLAFDVGQAMGGSFQGAGFVLGWTPGDATGDALPGPFDDPGQDLLQLALAKAGGAYTLHATRVVQGFNEPIDDEVLGDKVYVLEYGGSGGLWEVTFPQAPTAIQNGSFEATGAGWLLPWTFRRDLPATISQDSSTKALGSYSARVDVQQASASAYLVQLRQDGKRLVAGRTYTISFWAKGSATRPIEARLQGAIAPYPSYFAKSVQLGTAWQRYVLSYTATANDSNAFLGFNLAQATGQVWLDGVSLQDANLLANPSFEATGSTWLSPWIFRNDLGGSLVQDGSTRAQGSYSARVSVPTASTSAYQVQVRQQGKALVAGRTYAISFWAKASAARGIEVALQQAAAPYTLHFKRSLGLTTAWQQYTLTYAATSSDADAMLAFNLAQATGQVWLDDTSLVELP